MEQVGRSSGQQRCLRRSVPEHTGYYRRRATVIDSAICLRLQCQSRKNERRNSGYGGGRCRRLCGTHESRRCYQCPCVGCEVCQCLHKCRRLCRRNENRRRCRSRKGFLNRIGYYRLDQCSADLRSGHKKCGYYRFPVRDDSKSDRHPGEGFYLENRKSRLRRRLCRSYAWRTDLGQLV